MDERDTTPEDALEGYEHIRKLGKGSFGEVWLARDLGRREEVALKYLRLERLNPGAIAAFKREFEILSRIRHKNLALVFDFGHTQSDEYFFTSEYCPGKDFIRAASGKPYAYVEEMLVQTLAALDSVHAQGIVHFDIKSENIVVSDEGGRPHVKILDFGIAAKLKDLSEAVAGSVAYVAPEIILRQAHVDQRADLYAVGILLLRTLTRRLPFVVDNVDEVRQWHVRGEIPEALWAGTQIPRYMRELIEKLLRKRPEERFSSARVVLHFLNLSTARKYQNVEQDLSGVLPREGPLVERDAALEEIERRCAAAIEADGNADASPFCLLAGPQGIGKSRILAEFRRRLQLQEIRIVDAACHPQVPAWPTIERQLGLCEPCEEGVDEEWRMRLSVDAIIESCRGGPLCLLVDDLQHADRAFAKFLPALIDKYRFHRREGRSLPLFVLATTEGAGPETIALERLSTAGVERYVDLVLGDAEEARAIAPTLQRYSGGLPLLVVEGLRFVAPHLYRREPFEKLLPPPQIGELYRATIEGLPPEAQELLAILALLARPASADELSKILGLSPDDVEGIADACIRHDLLLGTPPWEEGPPSLRLSSEALGLDLVRSMEAASAAERCRAIAAGLEASDALPLVEIAAFTARGGDAGRSVAFYWEAASRFRKRQQVSQAAACLVRAADLCSPSVPLWQFLLREASDLLIASGSTREAEAYLAKLAVEDSPAVLELRGALSSRKGELAEAAENFRRALALLPPDAVAERIKVRNWLGSLSLRSGDAAAAARLFEETLAEEARLPERERRTIQNNALGSALAMLGRTDEAVRFYEMRLQALAPEMRAEALVLNSGMGYVLMQASRYEEAVPCLRRAIELSEETGAMRSLFANMGNLISALVKGAHYVEVFPLLAKMSRYQEKFGTTRDIAYNLLREGNVSLIVGMEEVAGECFRRGQLLSEELGDRMLGGWFHLLEGFRQREMERFDQAEGLFALACDEASEAHEGLLGAWSRYALAHLACEQGRQEECRRQLGLVKDPPDDEEFRVSFGILKARMAASDAGSDLDALFAPLEALCLERKLEEQRREVYHAWGRMAEERGDREAALRLMRKGVEIAARIAAELPEEYRDRYLRQFERRKLLRDVERLSGVSGD